MTILNHVCAKRFSKLAGISLLASILLFVTLASGDDGVPVPGDTGFVRHVLLQIDDQHRGNSSHGILEMQIKTTHWTRTLEMESWSLGKEHSLVKIIKPLKEKGTATLKAENTLYTYLNKTGRTIRINASMMGSAWMGSHFTNDDLVTETRLSDDFDATLIGDKPWGKKQVHVLELIPKEGRAIVYGKIQVGVFHGSLQPAWQLFFDEDGKKVRKMVYSDFRYSHGRLFPHRMKMTPLDKSGEYTSLQWKQIQFDVPLKKAFFSVHRLKSL
ncbi:MAG: outer membrane lipoprotein-sorting protein [Deltaproteobacteria bacterium]|nr:outer membrane lipoprotein-sorting protein [Deltaproteobacteria bacterium]